MARYYKKLPEVDAFLWTGGPDQTEDPEWIVEAIKQRQVKFEGGNMCLLTPYGVAKATPGTYIIRDEHNNLYTCDPDLFNKTYSLVRD